MKKPGVELIIGDITTLDVDAIVNAANSSLLGGGGVDGAIHKAAGPELYNECLSINGCETGKSVITSGYNLKARYIIHTVGPVWHGGTNFEFELLTSCYQTSLAIAKEKELKSIAFPGISTGAYRFPKNEAAMIAVNETKRFLDKNKYPERVIFVTFNQENFETYRKLLQQ